MERRKNVEGKDQESFSSCICEHVRLATCLISVSQFEVGMVIEVTKVRTTVLLTRTFTNQCVVCHACASRTAVCLVTTAPYQPALLPSGSIVCDYKNLWMNWPANLLVQGSKGMVAFTWRCLVISTWIGFTPVYIFHLFVSWAGTRLTVWSFHQSAGEVGSW